jgi:hypothetical protein
MPYDLSDDTGSQQQQPSQPDGAPSGRASDMLRGKTSPAAKAGPVSSSTERSIIIERREMPIDGIASSVFYLSLLVSLLGLAYLLWGVWSGSLALPKFTTTYGHDDRVRIVQNLQMVQNVVIWSTMLAVGTFLFLYYADTAAGYGLVVVGLFLNAGIPWLSQIFLNMVHATPCGVTTVPVVHFISSISWVPGVPGILLVVFDIVRRIIVGLEDSKTRKKSLRYGQSQTAASTTKRRNVFMGRCWNLPYCRSPLRERCPVYIKRMFPCWRYKQGCMCEENIAVLGSTADWKSAVAVAMAQLEGKPAPATAAVNPLLKIAGGTKIQLTWAEKKQRCRECVIYNTHQEQKYKLGVGVVFAATAYLLYAFNDLLLGAISDLFERLNAAVGHLSLASNGGTALFAAGVSGPVAWFILAFLTILVVSKVLQALEYCCFTIKV